MMGYKNMLYIYFTQCRLYKGEVKILWATEWFIWNPFSHVMYPFTLVSKVDKNPSLKCSHFVGGRETVNKEIKK